MNLPTKFIWLFCIVVWNEYLIPNDIGGQNLVQNNQQCIDQATIKPLESLYTEIKSKYNLSNLSVINTIFVRVFVICETFYKCSITKNGKKI